MVLLLTLTLFLFLNSASAQCDQGWEEADGTCYGFMQQKETWEVAQNICMSLNGRLAEPRSLVEDYIIKGIAAEHDADEIWLGASDIDTEDKWIWASDLFIVGVNGSFSDWNRHQPDNHNGHEDCLAYSKSYGHWNDKDCYDDNEFICTKPVNNPSSIVIG